MDSQIIARKRLDQILNSSINNSISRLLSVSELDDWMVEILWEELPDFFFACSIKDQLFDIKLFSSLSTFRQPVSSVSSNEFPHHVSDIAGVGGRDLNWLIFCCCCRLIFSCCCCLYWCCHNRFLIKSSLTSLGKQKAVSTLLAAIFLNVCLRFT